MQVSTRCDHIDDLARAGFMLNTNECMLEPSQNGDGWASQLTCHLGPKQYLQLAYSQSFMPQEAH